MKKFLLRLLMVALAALIVLLIWALWPTETRRLEAVSFDDSMLLEQGRYLAQAGDCTACHTSKEGAVFAGGLALESPIGRLYSSNITPDNDTGIGRYTLQDFDRALRHGINARGDTLYPAMPYPAYAAISDDDVRALYVFFMKGVTPVSALNRASDIPWPLSMRWPLALWRKVFAPSVDELAARQLPYPSEALARGAYLVQGLGHCGTCHTPRAMTLQEKALDHRSVEYLAGGPVIDGWLAVNLRGDDAAGLGRWSAEDIVSVLRSSRSATHAVLGSAMNDVVRHSTQYLTDDDLHAVALYLKSLPAVGQSASRFVADPKTALALAAGQESSRGAELYLDNCAACHRTHGLGDDQVFPSIAGNSSVLADNPVSLIRLTLAGASLPSTFKAPSPLGMPGFAWRLSNDEVAQLLSFIRSSWGNHATAVTAPQVEAVRTALIKEQAATEK